MSKLPRRITAGIVFSAVLFSMPAWADDQDTIDYRRHIMKTMEAEAATLGQMLQKKIPADDFAVHAQILAIAAATAKTAFEPRAPGGEARPEVWSNWVDFSRRLDELTAATAALAKLAKAGGIAAAGPKATEALTCKSCHDVFRVPQK